MPNSNVSAWIPELWAQEVLRHLKANLVLGRLVNRDYDSELAQAGETVNVPLPPVLAAEKKTAGTAFTPAAVTASTTPVKLDQHAVSAFEVDDIARIQARPDVMANYGRSAAIAIAEQVETDIFAEYASAAAAVGTAETLLGKASLLSARKLLLDAKVPASEGRFAVISTKDGEALLGDLSTTEATANAGDRSALREGSIGRLYGFDVYESQLAPTVTDDDDEVTHGLAGHRDGIVLVTRPLRAPEGAGVRVASVTDPDVGISIRVMMSFNHSTMQEVVSYDVLYGVATVRPTFIVDLVS